MIIKESEINMSQTEKSSFKTFRKQGHPRDSRGGKDGKRQTVPTH